MEGLERNIGYVFADRDLLLAALTHRSYFHENKGNVAADNERLEFLGDSVVGLIIVEYLFRMGDSLSESILARIKSYLVCESVFAGIAKEIGLSSCILLGKGEETTGGRKKASILANALEALIGALYVEAGYEKTRETVMKFFKTKIESIIEEGTFYDYKTELQEKTQLLYGTLPEYRLIKEQGEEHNRTFTVAVYVNDKKLGTASGRRKKEAETSAARKALIKMG